MDKTGGPAFPLPCQEDIDCAGRAKSGYGGMTLRDYFAAKALQGLLANGNGPYAPWIADEPCSPVTEKAYEIADAMLAARSKEEKDNV